MIARWCDTCECLCETRNKCLSLFTREREREMQVQLMNENDSSDNTHWWMRKQWHLCKKRKEEETNLHPLLLWIVDEQWHKWCWRVSPFAASERGEKRRAAHLKATCKVRCLTFIPGNDAVAVVAAAADVAAAAAQHNKKRVGSFAGKPAASFNLSC